MKTSSPFGTRNAWLENSAKHYREFGPAFAPAARDCLGVRARHRKITHTSSGSLLREPGIPCRPDSDPEMVSVKLRGFAATVAQGIENFFAKRLHGVSHSIKSDTLDPIQWSATRLIPYSGVRHSVERFVRVQLRMPEQRMGWRGRGANPLRGFSSHLFDSDGRGGGSAALRLALRALLAGSKPVTRCARARTHDLQLPKLTLCRFRSAPENAS